MAGNFWKSSHYQQWILEKCDLLRERGRDMKYFTEEEYQKILIFFTNFITNIAVHNPHGKYHQQVIATACVYFRRFYARRSFKDIDPFLLAPTCLILAAKVEEHGVHSNTKFAQFVHHILKQYPFQIDAVIRAGTLTEAEFYLLEIMDCCLIVYHPYRPLNQFLHDMKAAGIRDAETLYQDAWRVCNDSLKTDVALLFAPHVIALGAIMVALLLPSREKDKDRINDKEVRTWFAEFSVDIDKVSEVQQTILSMYKLTKSYDENKTIEPLLKRLPKPSAHMDTDPRSLHMAHNGRHR